MKSINFSIETQLVVKASEAKAWGITSFDQVWSKLLGIILPNVSDLTERSLKLLTQDGYVGLIFCKISFDGVSKGLRDSDKEHSKYFLVYRML